MYPITSTGKSTIRDRYGSSVRYDMAISRKNKIDDSAHPDIQLEEVIATLSSKLKDYENLYIRQRAEMENYVRAKEKEMARVVLNASHDVIRNILPVLDALDSAIVSSSDSENMKALRSNLIKVLEKYGLKEIPAKGEKFDPFLHEVIAVVNAKEDGIIQEEYQKGYKLNDEVLRTSKVVVGKKGE